MLGDVSAYLSMAVLSSVISKFKTGKDDDNVSARNQTTKAVRVLGVEAS